MSKPARVPKSRSLETLRTWLAGGFSEQDTVIYHVGQLSFDRMKLRKDGDKWLTERIEPFDTIAALFWEAYEQGKVLLYQVRVAPYSFAYYAKRRIA